MAFSQKGLEQLLPEINDEDENWKKVTPSIRNDAFIDDIAK